MNRNKFLDFYASHIWPIVRSLVSKPRRCRNCILSERYAPLIEDLCPECSTHKQATSPEFEVSEETQLRFDGIVKNCTNSERYDAVLLLSGGKDSAYILYRLKTEYPELRILCVTVNNGFMSPTAISNADFVSQKLKVDLLLSNDRIDEFSTTLRHAFLDLQGRGSYGVIDHADGELIFKIGQQIASDLGIQTVIAGLSWVQVQRIVGRDDFEMRQEGAPHIIFPLAVWRTNEQKIREIVQSEKLLPPGTDSPIVSNSSLILAMAAIDIKNLGYSSFEPEFAQLVREGKTDRRVWLHLFELLEFAGTRGFLDSELKEVLGTMNLNIEDVVRGPK